MGLHWDFTLRDDDRPYNYADDGDLYDLLKQQDDQKRHDALAAHLKDLTVTLGRIHMDGSRLDRLAQARAEALGRDGQ